MKSVTQNKKSKKCQNRITPNTEANCECYYFIPLNFFTVSNSELRFQNFHCFNFHYLTSSSQFFTHTREHKRTWNWIEYFTFGRISFI